MTKQNDYFMFDDLNLPKEVSFLTDYLLPHEFSDYVRRYFDPIIGILDANLKPSPNRFYEGTPCHEWQRTPNNVGYGQIGYHSIAYPAHRIAFYKAHGRFPGPNLEVHHLCENKLCCNPAHLKEVTRRENMDAVATRSNPQRLSESDVWHIRFTYRHLPQKTLCEMFNIKYPTTIINILKNRTYKSITFQSLDSIESSI